MKGNNSLDIYNQIKITIEKGLIIPVTASSIQEDSTFEIFCYTQDPEMKILLKMEKFTITKAYNNFFNPTKIEGLSVTVHGHILMNLHKCISMFVNDITIASTPIPIPESLQIELGAVKGVLFPQQWTEIGRSSSTKDPKMKVSNILNKSVDLDEDVEVDAWKDDNGFDNDEDYPTESLSDKLTEFSNRVYGTIIVEENGQASKSSVLVVEKNTEKVQYDANTVESTEANDIFYSTETEEVATVFENIEIKEVVTVIKYTEDGNAVEPTQDKKIIDKQPTNMGDNNAMDTDHFDAEDENSPVVKVTIVPPNETSVSPVEISRESEYTDNLLPLKRKTMIVLNDELLNLQNERDIQFGINQRGSIRNDEEQQHIVLHEFSSIGKSSGVVGPKRKKKSKMTVNPEDLRRSPRLALKERVKYFLLKRVKLLRNY